MISDNYILENLKRALQQGKMHPVILFSGKKSDSVLDFCRKFFSDVLKMDMDPVTPDLIWINGAEERIKLEDANRVLDHLSVRPVGNYRVVFIHMVEQMTADSANHLLKTLEEPPSQVVFVLTTLQPRNVIATIRSRAFMVRIPQTIEPLKKRGDLSLVEDHLHRGMEVKFAELARVGKGTALKSALEDFEIELSGVYRQQLKNTKTDIDFGKIARRRDLLSRLRNMVSKKKITLNTQLALESIVAVQHSRNESSSS